MPAQSTDVRVQDTSVPAVPETQTPPVQVAPVEPAPTPATPQADPKLKEYEAKLAAAENNLAKIREVFDTVPGLREQAIKFYQTGETLAAPKPAEVVAPPPTEPDEDAPLTRADLKAQETQLRGQLESGQAVRDWHLRLGGGDPVKGEEIFEKEFAPKVEGALKIMNSGTPSQRLGLVMSYIQAIAAANKPAAPPPPPGEVRNEGGGTAGTPPRKTAMNDDEILRESLAEIGFSGPTAKVDYMRSLGALA